MVRTRRRRGASALEYGLLAALIAIACLVGVTVLQGRLLLVFCRLTILASHLAGPGGSPEQAALTMLVFQQVRGVHFDDHSGGDGLVEVGEYGGLVLADCEFMSSVVPMQGPSCAEQLDEIDLPAQHAQMDVDDDGFLSRTEYTTPTPQ